MAVVPVKFPAKTTKLASNPSMAEDVSMHGDVSALTISRPSNPDSNEPTLRSYPLLSNYSISVSRPPSVHHHGDVNMTATNHGQHLETTGDDIANNHEHDLKKTSEDNRRLSMVKATSATDLGKAHQAPILARKNNRSFSDTNLSIYRPNVETNPTSAPWQYLDVPGNARRATISGIAEAGSSTVTMENYSFTSQTFTGRDILKAWYNTVHDKGRDHHKKTEKPHHIHHKTTTNGSECAVQVHYSQHASLDNQKPNCPIIEIELHDDSQHMQLHSSKTTMRNKEKSEISEELHLNAAPSRIRRENSIDNPDILYPGKKYYCVPRIYGPIREQRKYIGGIYCIFTGISLMIIAVVCFFLSLLDTESSWLQYLLEAEALVGILLIITGAILKAKAVVLTEDELMKWRMVRITDSVKQEQLDNLASIDIVNIASIEDGET